MSDDGRVLGQGVDVDVAVVGAGIVGLATARELLRRVPGRSVVVVEKEDAPATHQSGRNSGVLHAGVYYAPGSAKAALCQRGRASMLAFCAEHGVAVRTPGKLVVATHTAELGRLEDLARRCARNGVTATLIGRREVAEHEPHVDGIAALWVPSTGVVDFRSVCAALAVEVAERGTVRLRTEVVRIADEPRAATIHTTGGPLRVGAFVNCAGLHADELARGAGLTVPAVLPFRGEYHELRPEAAPLVRGLVYPVPDPALPFLGVHLTRGIDDRVHVGPSAVPALGRETYGWRAVRPAAALRWLRTPGVAGLARRHWRTELAEVTRSASRAALANAVRRLVPEIAAVDLLPSPSGVRAQAVTADGELLDDFSFADGHRGVHVVNAPSPAATASLAIAEVIVDRLEALDERPGGDG